MGISTDCIGSCKSNYHAITATAAPWWFYKSDLLADIYFVFFIFFLLVFFLFNLLWTDYRLNGIPN
jgi:hypothetical protein